MIDIMFGVAGGIIIAYCVLISGVTAYDWFVEHF